MFTTNALILLFEVLTWLAIQEPSQPLCARCGNLAPANHATQYLTWGGWYACAEETSGRQYAMKRMRKSAVVQCPEHVFCEQAITRNTAHPFCLRQYASFQDKLHLYFLFDLMPGGDLMDVLVAEARVIKRRIAQGAWKRACLAPKARARLAPAPLLP